MDSRQTDAQLLGGLQAAIRLCEQELLRLQEELEVIRSSDHPERRTLILGHVNRIDERQDALEELRAAIEDPQGG